MAGIETLTFVSIRTSRIPIERFMSHVKKGSGCWMWMGGCARRYGKIWWGGRLESAHRVSFTIHIGPIPDGLNVLHKCDVRGCVNPEHLFLGTQSDNLRDMVQKGRNFFLAGDDHPFRRDVTLVARGERASKSKLTEKQVLDIRKLSSSGAATRSQLSQMFGVTPRSICDVLNRKSWTHVL